MKLLYSRGYFVARAPGSGSKVVHYPIVDVIAIKRNLILLFEVKRRREKDSIPIDKNQIAKLKEAEQLTGGKAFIAVYIDSSRSWYFFTLDQLQDRGNHYLISVNEFYHAKGVEILTD